MTESEKLDIILMKLYEVKENNSFISFRDIISQNKLEINFNDVNRISKRLKDESLVDGTAILGGDFIGKLTSYGIEYCETNSHTNSGTSIVLNNYSINISNSPNSNVVNNSSNVSISINNKTEIEEVIKELVKITEQLNDVPQEKIIEILEGISEIKACIEADRKPKHSLRGLMSITSDIITIAPYISKLGMLLGQI